MAIEFKMIIFGQPGVIHNVYLELYMTIYWIETFYGQVDVKISYYQILIIEILLSEN